MNEEDRSDDASSDEEPPNKSSGSLAKVARSVSAHNDDSSDDSEKLPSWEPADEIAQSLFEQFLQTSKPKRKRPRKDHRTAPVLTPPNRRTEAAFDPVPPFVPNAVTNTNPSRDVLNSCESSKAGSPTDSIVRQHESMSPALENSNLASLAKPVTSEVYGRALQRLMLLRQRSSVTRALINPPPETPHAAKATTAAALVSNRPRTPPRNESNDWTLSNDQDCVTQHDIQRALATVQTARNRTSKDETHQADEANKAGELTPTFELELRFQEAKRRAESKRKLSEPATTIEQHVTTTPAAIAKPTAVKGVSDKSKRVSGSTPVVNALPTVACAATHNEASSHSQRQLRRLGEKPDPPSVADTDGPSEMQHRPWRLADKPDPPSAVKPAATRTEMPAVTTAMPTGQSLLQLQESRERLAASRRRSPPAP